MAQPKGVKPTRVKLREHRVRRRARGLGPVQIWAPDVSAPSFPAEAHLQSLAVTATADAAEDQAFVDSASDGCAELGGAIYKPYREARIMRKSRARPS
jgi:hypothetical protein